MNLLRLFICIFFTHVLCVKVEHGVCARPDLGRVGSGLRASVKSGPVVIRGVQGAAER